MLEPHHADAVARAFSLGGDTVLIGPPVRGEQGQIWRLNASRGSFAVKESFEALLEYPIVGVCPPNGHGPRSGSDDLCMERWVVECEVCGRTFEVGGPIPPTRSSMGPHAMLGRDRETVVEGSRCAGSYRPGRWTRWEPTHSVRAPLRDGRGDGITRHRTTASGLWTKIASAIKTP